MGTNLLRIWLLTYNHYAVSSGSCIGYNAITSLDEASAKETRIWKEAVTTDYSVV